MKISLKNKELSLFYPAIMGILNVTPDSFYDGGKYADEKSILDQADKILSEGADILDIGACSTRPNTTLTTEEDELKRLLPIIKLIRKHFPGAIISADTFRSKVAEEAVNEGADMINDISGGTMDSKMFDTIGQLNVPYVLMHIQGTPPTMQQAPQYKNVTAEVLSYFTGRIQLATSKGIKQLILDPGFGFGKTIEHNFQLLKELSLLKSFGHPILAGISRKSMIYQVLGTTPDKALNGTTAANIIALMNGANILRVHDVLEAKEAVKIFNFTK